VSKWRPVPLNCLYVIGDIHGQFRQLKLICNRIFPLRKSDGGADVLVCLGDYIDRGPNSPEVIDFLIKAKRKYKDQIILLRGNHEQMFIDAAGFGNNIITSTSDPYRMWMGTGGEFTLSQYLKRAKLDYDNPYTFPRQRIKDIIPKEHVEFLNNLIYSYDIDNYIFVHGGIDINLPISEQSHTRMMWDRVLYNKVIRNIPIEYSKTIVAGHNGDGSPLIVENYYMIDVSITHQLMVLELNSMEAFIAKRGKDRLVKLNF